VTRVTASVDDTNVLLSELAASVGAAEDPLTGLARLRDLLEAARALEVELVRAARAEKASYAAIGRARGTSAQAVHALMARRDQARKAPWPRTASSPGPTTCVDRSMLALARVPVVGRLAPRRGPAAGQRTAVAVRGQWARTSGVATGSEAGRTPGTGATRMAAQLLVRVRRTWLTLQSLFEVIRRRVRRIRRSPAPERDGPS